MARLLVIEDDPAVQTAVARALRLEGYETHTASDGTTGLHLLTDQDWDLAVVDVMMPGLDGLELCRRLRASGDRTPVLMLTARHETVDRVAGLDAGADDYLVKPFDLAELFARVRALLRRSSPTAGEAVQVGSLCLDDAARRVTRHGHEIELTKTEYDLLLLLARHAGQVLTRDVIYDRIWGYTFDTTSNPLEVYVGYLRRKTEAGGADRLIHTVRGVGYVLRPDAP